MAGALQDKTVALFVANLYEDLEFWYPYYRLKEEGAEVVAIGPDAIEYTGKHGIPTKADEAITAVRPDTFDAVVIPGGFSPDYMRRKPEMVEFVKEMHESKKVVAAICHGGWMLASAKIVKDRAVTSFISISDDMTNAGARWEDQSVVVDDGIITSRFPDDLPDFCQAIIGELS